jgi:hypothetical protein
MEEKPLAETLNEKLASVSELNELLDKAREEWSQIDKADSDLGNKLNKKYLSNLPSKNRIMVENPSKGESYTYRHYYTVSQQGFGSTYGEGSHTSYYSGAQDMLESGVLKHLPTVMNGIKHNKRDQFRDVTNLMAKYIGKIKNDEKDLTSIMTTKLSDNFTKTNWQFTHKSHTKKSAITHIAIQISYGALSVLLGDEKLVDNAIKKNEVERYGNDFNYEFNGSDQWEEYAVLEQVLPEINDFVAKHTEKLKGVLKQYHAMDKELDELAYYIAANEL